MAVNVASIADEVHRMRVGAGLTQAGLAARIGTTQSAVSRLESGRLVPTLAVLGRVAEATGRPITIVVGPVRHADAAAAAPPPPRTVPPARPIPSSPAGRPLPSRRR